MSGLNLFFVFLLLIQTLCFLFIETPIVFFIRTREKKMSSRDMERGRKHRGDTQWTSWLTPTIVVANVAIFIVVMFINDCPKTTRGAHGDCVAKFLGRFSFQPLRENPLLGPSSSTWVSKKLEIRIFVNFCCLFQFLNPQKSLFFSPFFQDFDYCLTKSG